MTRLEFLTRMEECLAKQLSKSEMSAIMRNLIDYFNDCERRGKREVQITKELGDPQRVAMQMVARSRVKGLSRHPGFVRFIRAQFSLHHISFSKYLLSLLIAIPIIFMYLLFVLTVLVISFAGLAVIVTTVFTFQQIPISVFLFLFFGGITLLGFAVTLSYILHSISRKVIGVAGRMYSRWCIHSKRAAPLMFYEAGGIDG